MRGERLCRREVGQRDIHVQELRLFSSYLPAVISPVCPIHGPPLSLLLSYSGGSQLHYPEFGRGLLSVSLSLYGFAERGVMVNTDDESRDEWDGRKSGRTSFHFFIVME